MTEASRQNDPSAAAPPVAEIAIAVGADAPPPPQDEEEEDQWDLVRLLDDSSSSTTIPCRTANCSGSAVAVWATHKAPTDEWNLCAACIYHDFGCAPDGSELQLSIEMNHQHLTPPETPPPTSSSATDNWKRKHKEESSSTTTTLPQKGPEHKDPQDDDDDDDCDEPTSKKARVSSSKASPASHDAASVPPPPPGKQPKEDDMNIPSTPSPTKNTSSSSSSQQDTPVWSNKKAARRSSSDDDDDNVDKDDTIMTSMEDDDEGALEPTDPMTTTTMSTVKIQTAGAAPISLSFTTPTTSKKAAPLLLLTQASSSSTTTPASNKEENITTTPQGTDAVVATETEEESYDLNKIFSLAELSSSQTQGHILCSVCQALPACCLYVSNHQTKQQERWYYCLDCQHDDFGGWPQSPHEVPIHNQISSEHQALMVQLCSSATLQEHHRTAFPSFLLEEEASSMTATKQGPPNPFVTPPPVHVGAIAAAAAAGSKKQGQVTAMITPAATATTTSKAKPTAASKGARAAFEKWQAAAEKLGLTTKIVVDKTAAKKLIYEALYDSFAAKTIDQLHKVSVLCFVYVVCLFVCLFVCFVLSRLLVFTFQELFTHGLSLFHFHVPCSHQLWFQEMKGIVPAPLLSGCLQDMSLKDGHDDNPFDNSDDSDSDDDSDGGGAKKKKNKKKKNSKKQADTKTTTTTTDPYQQSLSFKPGRTTQSNLYFVNHTKLTLLDHDQRNELLNNCAIADQELASLQSNVQRNLEQAKQLQSEPTNEQAATQLEHDEALVVELQEKVQAGRKLKVNDSHKKKLKASIQTMTRYWRQRRKLCMDALLTLEEVTEGSVDRKKCLKGDGAICLDNDDQVVQSAEQFVKEKLARQARAATAGAGTSSKTTTSSKKNKNNKGLTSSSGKKAANKRKTEEPSLANERFVGVLLNSQGLVDRVYVDGKEFDDEEE